MWAKSRCRIQPGFEISAINYASSGRFGVRLVRSSSHSQRRERRRKYEANSSFSNSNCNPQNTRIKSLSLSAFITRKRKIPLCVCSVTRAETDRCFTRSSARHLGAKEIIHKRRFRYTFPLKVGKRNRTNRALTREHERVFSSSWQ